MKREHLWLWRDVILYEEPFPKVKMQLDTKTCMAEEEKKLSYVDMNQNIPF